VAALLVAAVALTVQVRELSRVWALAVVPLLALLLVVPKWEVGVLYAGLFRQREPLPFAFDGIDRIRREHPKWLPDNIVFHEDDPITSVTVRKNDNDGIESLSIATNGKSDGDTYLDYATMGLVAVLSAMLADDARQAFVIGWGTGVTAGELAAVSTIERVDVAEISPGVVHASPLFDFASLGASKSRKIHVIQSDAYRALMRSDQQYDLVISEPSNPWVAGVEMLFSREFLAAAKSKLTEGGVYCQWFHQYEVDSETVETVLRTYREVFDHVAVWRANHSDLMLLGFNKEGPALDHYRLEARAERPDFKSALARSGVFSFPALLAHEVMPLGVLHVANLEGPVHTLYHPILSHLAGRAFYRGERGEVPFTGYGEPARIGQKNSMARAYFERFGGNPPDRALGDYVRQVCVITGPRCEILLHHWLGEHPDSAALQGVLALLESSRKGMSPEKLQVATHFYGSGREILDGEPIVAEDSMELTDDYIRSYSHAVPYDPRALEAVWASCRKEPPSRSECQRIASTRAEGGAFASLPTSDDLNEAVQQCMERRSVSRQCEDGARQVRAMFETGELPKILEYWKQLESRD